MTSRTTPISSRSALPSFTVCLRTQNNHPSPSKAARPLSLTVSPVCWSRYTTCTPLLSNRSTHRLNEGLARHSASAMLSSCIAKDRGSSQSYTRALVNEVWYVPISYVSNVCTACVSIDSRVGWFPNARNFRPCTGNPMKRWTCIEASFSIYKRWVQELVRSRQPELPREEAASAVEF